MSQSPFLSGDSSRKKSKNIFYTHPLTPINPSLKTIKISFKKSGTENHSIVRESHKQRLNSLINKLNIYKSKQIKNEYANGH